MAPRVESMGGLAVESKNYERSARSQALSVHAIMLHESILHTFSDPMLYLALACVLASVALILSINHCTRPLLPFVCRTHITISGLVRLSSPVENPLRTDAPSVKTTPRTKQGACPPGYGAKFLGATLNLEHSYRLFPCT